MHTAFSKTGRSGLLRPKGDGSRRIGEVDALAHTLLSPNLDHSRVLTDLDWVHYAGPKSR
jgi:hypothetical protein